LPPVELPRLRINATRLQNEEERLQIRLMLNEMFEEKNIEQDSWQAFTEEMRDIGRSLAQWTRPAAPETEPPPNKIALTAPKGWSLFVEWVAKPYDRKLLFAPPVQAVWITEPGQLAGPIMLVFLVNPNGGVVDIEGKPNAVVGASPESQVLLGAIEALSHYRYEPLDEEPARNQRGILIIGPEALAR